MSRSDRKRRAAPGAKVASQFVSFSMPCGEGGEGPPMAPRTGERGPAGAPAQAGNREGLPLLS
jgi:hypothetical protein